MHKRRAAEYYNNRHSFFLLQYRLVIVTKYRKPIINEDIKNYINEYTLKYFKDRNTRIKKLEILSDRISIIFDAFPQINLAEFINAYKTASARKIRQKFNKYLDSYYDEPTFWSRSYFIGTLNEESENALGDFLKNQTK